jgi:hypothetical protein
MQKHNQKPLEERFVVVIHGHAVLSREEFLAFSAVSRVRSLPLGYRASGLDRRSPHFKHN